MSKKLLPTNTHSLESEYAAIDNQLLTTVYIKPILFSAVEVHTM